MAEKTCTACLRDLPLTKFRWRKDRNGFASHCKRCASMSNIYRLYGITIQQYDELREAQEYSCAICGTHEDDVETRSRSGNARYRKLVIDHDHVTHQVRGLLCHDCNVMLGNAKDRTDVLSRAIEYLSE